MPGYDGTGPCGEGPMTGRGDGYCMLEIPVDPHLPRTGFAGLRGQPVELPSMWGAPDVLALCRAQIELIRDALPGMNRRLIALEAVVRSLSAARHGATDDDAGAARAPSGSDGGVS